MKLETILNKLCCPFDKSDLELHILTKNEEAEVIEGVLQCQICSRVYPIITGIPIMTPDEFRDKNLEQPLLDKWNKLMLGEESRKQLT